MTTPNTTTNPSATKVANQIIERLSEEGYLNKQGFDRNAAESTVSEILEDPMNQWNRPSNR
jgi:hypothetical protein